MFRHGVKPNASQNQSCEQGVRASLGFPAVLLVTSLATGVVVQKAHAAPAPADPFKVANIHFETNASACDMGIQIKFDTDGVTDGSVEDPNGHQVYSFGSAGDLKTTGGQTEGFLEGVEPQITELVLALGCGPSDEGVMSLADLFDSWPAGDYTFNGTAKGAAFSDQATLTHHIPAGPKIVAPADGKVVPDKALLIDWDPVTEAILPSLGPVHIVGYHLIVEEAVGEASPELDVDLPSSETSVTVPAQYLKPNTVYKFEVLSTERSGNQTITEGFFCTTGVTVCALPE